MSGPGHRGSRRLLQTSRTTVAYVASGIATAVGALVVLGWAAGAPLLERALLPSVVVKANTGVSIMLLGLGAFLIIRPGGTPIRRWLSLGCVAAAGSIATLTIVEYVTGTGLGIDNVLFSEAPGAPETGVAGRMALGTAIGIMLIAGAIAPLALTRGRSRLSAALATLGAILGGVSLLGRLYGSPELTGLGAGTLIAPATAIALGSLAAGILANPAVRSPAEILGRPTIGGRVGRGLTIATITILPLVGLIGEVTVDAGILARGFQVSLVTALGVIALIAVGLVLASRLDRLESDLETTAATLRAILDASPLAIIALDADSEVVFWSRGAEQLYGWTADEVLGRVPPHAPEDLGPVLADQWLRVRAGESLLHEETSRLAKSGERVDIAVSVVPLRDPDSRITGLLSVQEDIRERKRLETELIEAHKMQTVGRLAGGIAHNFNNILTAIIGYTELVLREPLETNVRRDLEAVRAAAGRAGSLTQQILAFGRRQTLREEPVDVGDLLLGLEPMLRQLVGDRVDLAVVVSRGAGSFIADPVQFEQILLNLALNARDAMPGGGRLVIRADHARFDAASPPPRSDMPSGGYVVVSVADTGTGMDPETQTHIFEPFFTTKEVGNGTGLGLSTSYGIVKQMHGEIVVESAPAQGTTFRLYFPSVQQGSALTHLPRRARRTILVAEDDPMVLALTTRALEAAGFEVLGAADGAEALSIANTHGLESIDLVITDAAMPRVRGAELASRLREQRPGLPIVVMSGYDDEVGNAVSTEHWIAKPFSPDELVALVRQEFAAAPRERAEAASS